MDLTDFAWNSIHDLGRVFVGRASDEERQNSLSLTRMRIKSLYHPGDNGVENVHGYNVNYILYDELMALYYEIFMQEQYYFNHPNDSPYIIDCGSNIGMSVLYFKEKFPNATIKAFEPDPFTFGMLQKNIVNNLLTNVTPYNMALSDDVGEHEFYIHPSNICMSLYVKNGAINRIWVKTDRLSSYIDRDVDFLKFDVEASEYNILKDLDENKKLSYVRRLIMEYHPMPNDANPIFGVLSILSKNNFVFKIRGFQDQSFKDPVDKTLLIYAHR